LHLVYLEASGNPKSVEQGLHCIRKAGNFVEFSVFSKPTTVDWTIIGDTKELNIYGAHLSGNTGYSKAIDMLVNGMLPIEKIISHSLPLENFKEGIELVSSGISSLKVVLDPNIDFE
jgi:threonine dehydrogenase-like Zn-dependent dehydrogenase